jgi:hypothetical protein
MVISQSAGRWHAAATGLPADATDFYDARISSISCPSIGNCLAVGTYSSRQDEFSSFAVTETDGRWRRPVRTSIAPANAARLANLELDSVTCTRPGVCLAVGNYTSRNRGLLMMAAVDAGGRWTRAKEITLPGDAHSSVKNEIFADGGAVACPSSGNCTSVGSYQHGITPSGVPVTSADAAQIAPPGGH